MDQEILVNHLKKLIIKFGEDEKRFVLAMLIPIDSDIMNTKYTLLFSADWLDNKNPKDAVNLMVKAIIDQIGSPNNPEFNQISRVTVIKTIDPFVNAVTSAFNVSDSVMNISNCNINGIEIESGIILEAHRPKLKTTSQSTKVGRNDPCTCGSGKKYKRCCGK